MILSRLVKPRARRTADMVASVPLLVMAHLLDRGHEADDELGHLNLVGVGRAEGGAALRARSAMAALMRGVVVAVDRRAPGADEVDQLAAVGGGERGAAGGPWRRTGAPPTERKARTGESTPPGMSWRARVKRDSELEFIS